ncbi:creatininase family protein [Collimonas sp. NPDC087041]|uniref:creatininase family protein n=1 Tax=Collimonas sp. NPDC087041 TaxID=3363960 RepID=UPI00381E6AF8
MHFPVRRTFVSLIFLAASHLAFAQAPKTVFIEDLTWTELRDQVQAGKTTIIIPIGATEQSGPDVALGKHNVRVKILSQRIAEGLGNAFVAPVIAYVPEGNTAPPTSHMRFPGTITIPDDVFEKMLESAANSFKVHGFKNIVFLGDHGGYQNNIKKVVASLNKAWSGSPARAIVPPEYYASSSDGFAQILRQRGFRDDEIGTHAGLADTSLLLAVAPQMVRQDRLRSSQKLGLADGVYGGDPRRSSAELGQLGIDAIVSRTVAALKADTAAR